MRATTTIDPSRNRDARIGRGKPHAWRPFCLLRLAAAGLLLGGGAARADSGGSDWNSSYALPGTAKHQTNQTQADLIAKRESGYYDGLGKSQVYNITTTSVGTMNTMNTTIDGSNNHVGATSTNSGGLDASVLVQSLTSSVLSSQNRAN